MHVGFDRIIHYDASTFDGYIAMFRVFCFGEALIDFHGVASQSANTFHAHVGGAPANVAVAVARLGGASAFVGMLGRDMFGDRLFDALNQACVNTEYVKRTTAANTALAFVSHTADGDRRFSFYRPPAADLLFRCSHFDATIFSGDRLFHAGSCSMSETAAAQATLYGLEKACVSGALTSFDMNWRPALWPPHTDPKPLLWKALKLARFVKLSAEEWMFLREDFATQEALLDAFWQGHTQWLVVTDGGKPLHWFTPSNRGQLEPCAIKPVDTTGAGDAFTGACLYQLAQARLDAEKMRTLTGQPARLEAILRFAMHAGGLAATRVGSFDAMPRYDEVNALMRQTV